MSEKAPAVSMSSRQVVDAVERWLAKGNAESCVFIREARSAAGFDGNAGQLDLIAINAWQSRGLERVGVEVKVSRSDWQRELAKPRKAELFYGWCHRWYLAVPAPYEKIVREDLPSGWGLLETTPTTTKVIAPSPKLDAAEPPWRTVAGWFAQIDRRRRAIEERDLSALVAAEVERRKTAWTEDAARGLKHREERVQAANEAIARLSEATGIDLARAWSPDLERIGQMWARRHELATVAKSGAFTRAIESLQAVAAVFGEFADPDVAAFQASSRSA